mmetsp:Transcript_1187/g.5021  ORF Transcript_1187/g.5021 Transcript_1187/m.5021 type:complete len:89 (+) Transcript_1187:379-645(+)
MILMADEYLIPELAEVAALCLCKRLCPSVALHALGVCELVPRLRLLRVTTAVFILRNLTAVASTTDASETGLGEDALLEQVLHTLANE